MHQRADSGPATHTDKKGRKRVRFTLGGQDNGGPEKRDALHLLGETSPFSRDQVFSGLSPVNVSTLILNLCLSIFRVT